MYLQLSTTSRDITLLCMEFMVTPIDLLQQSKLKIYCYAKTIF